MSLPKISIVIPSYNKSRYLGKTLKSIVSQNYQNFEIIIKDGGSTDGSIEIIKKYAAKFPDKIFWSSQKDSGQTDAINKGFKQARGEIIGYINADDVYQTGALLAVGNAYARNPQSGWVAGLGDIIDDKDQVIFPLVSLYKNFLIRLNNYSFLLTVNYLTQPSVFISKKAYQEFGPFIDYDKGFVMEYDLWLKLGKIEMPLIINKCLSSFRLIKTNASILSQKDLLSEDYKAARQNTKNMLILSIHKFHNIGRISLAKYLK